MMGGICDTPEDAAANMGLSLDGGHPPELDIRTSREEFARVQSGQRALSVTRDIAQEKLPCTGRTSCAFHLSRTSRGRCARKGSFSAKDDLKYRMSTRERLVDQLRYVTLRDTEERALQVMALRTEAAELDSLLNSQHRSGAWSADTQQAPANCFHTALALIALRPFGANPRVADATYRAFDWLDMTRGLENHWLWKWKFRFFDRQVRFDPAKTGWPWIEGTVSWVAPTAMTLLAHRAWQRDTPRVPIAEAMLIDRACPGGGWNAGNAEVFGVPLEPHVDFTAMALLALRPSRHGETAVIRRALTYLSGRSSGLTSTYSMAWAAMALSAWNAAAAGTVRRLEERLHKVAANSVPVREMCLAALALEVPPFVFRGGGDE